MKTKLMMLLVTLMAISAQSFADEVAQPEQLAPDESAIDTLMKQAPVKSLNPPTLVDEGPKAHRRMMRCEVVEKSFTSLAPYAIDVFQDTVSLEQTQGADALGMVGEGVLITEYRPKFAEKNMAKISKNAVITDIMRSRTDLMISSEEDGISISIGSLEYTGKVVGDKTGGEMPVNIMVRVADKTVSLPYNCAAWEL